MRHLALFASLIFFAACPSVDETFVDAAPVPPPDAAIDADQVDADQVDADVVDATIDASIDAAPTPGPGCASWSFDLDTLAPATAERSARIELGGLLLTSRGDGEGQTVTAFMPWEAIKVYQQPLVGDFVVTAEIEGLDGESFTAISLFATTTDGWTMVQSTLHAVDDGQGAIGTSMNHEVSFADVVPTRQATLRLRREAEWLYLEATSGDHTVTQTEFTSSDMFVGLSLNEGTTAALTRARVSSFTVEGGGGAVRSDSFDCPSLIHE